MSTTAAQANNTNTIDTGSGSSVNHEIPAPRSLLKSGLILNDKWEILEHIASGGKGDVYRAHQKSLHRSVALKVISSNFLDSLKDDISELEAERERFRREVRVMASIRHSYVLQVIDFDRCFVDGEELEYIVMEYIPGSTLRGTMPEQGYGMDRSAVTSWLKQYFLPVLQGLIAVHDSGVIHRDIKPENIMLDGSTPKIADFGLARAQNQSRMTQTFHVLGTIFYMPKEQFEDGASVDARADIYALGKILLEFVHGKIANKNRMAFKQAKLDLSLCPAGDKDFFQTLDSIIQSATAEEVQERTPDAVTLYRDLDTLVGYSEEGVEAEGKRNLKKGLHALYAALGIVAMGGMALLVHHLLNQPPDPAMEAPPQAAQVIQEIQTDRSARFTPKDQGNPPARSADNASAGSHPKSQMLVESDGAVMRLAAGGGVSWVSSIAGQQQADGKDFYIEEGPVTNERFVNFLNSVRDTLTVQNSVVQSAEGIYMLLGEIREGYEPILFRDGVFTLSSSEMAQRPVVRVSPKGAEAYAHYYNRALPTVPQWLLARENGLGLGESYGLTDEWGYENSDDGHFFMLLGAGKDSLKETKGVCPPMRQKWEAFSDVGFRTVRNTTTSSNE
ncbi:MAG: bifunctional serine/threonine-protein kinase/formylglycine-generating enzyme family protein [Desulfovibrio sp.]|nr:bifunctional serine/threonine-protein kinase/formylglycine-generating enzyme family protein [Desulfovibrio sp.]